MNLNDKKRLLQRLGLGVGIVLVAFMHLYKLTDVPFGLNVDEAGAAYDALNIANYGVDRWLNRYPVYFTNYGDGQNALYIYMTAILVKIFGMSKLVIRATITAAAFVAAVTGYFYVSKEYKRPMVANVFLLLYGIIPVFTTMQRFGLESHLMLSMAMVCILSVMLAVEKSDWRYYLFAGIVCGVTLYTYALSYFVVPIFAILCCAYVLRLKTLDVKKTVAFVVPLAILAFPLVLVQVVNYFELPQMMVGPFTITKLNRYRADEVGGFNIWKQIGSMIRQCLIYGEHAYNSPRQYGTMYYISIPFIVVGFVIAVIESIVAFRDRTKSYAVPVVAWTIGELVMGATLANPNNTRMNGIFMPLLYFLVKGFVWCYDKLQKVKFRNGIVIVITGIYTCLFISFAKFYFCEYNEKNQPFDWLFYESYEEVSGYLEEHAGEEFVAKGTCYPWNYVYYCLEFEVNPYEINIPANGIEEFGVDSINEYPGHVALMENYAVYKTDVASMEYLDSLGYFSENLDDFSFYKNVYDTFEREVAEDVLFTIDRMDAQDEKIEISGWTVENREAVSVFEEVYMQIDGVEYRMENRERKDIASHFGNEECLYAGCYIELPLNALEKAEEINFYAQQDDEKRLIATWFRTLED